jgi:hypothetical protein
VKIGVSVRYDRIRTRACSDTHGETSDRTDTCDRTDSHDGADRADGAVISAGLIGKTARQAEQAAAVAEALADLEHQIVAKTPFFLLHS